VLKKLSWKDFPFQEDLSDISIVNLDEADKAEILSIESSEEQGHTPDVLEYIQDNVNWDMSVKAVQHDEMVGYYLLSSNPISSVDEKGVKYFEDLESYEGKSGTEGVSLYVKPQYRKLGIASLLKDYAENVGSDYVWGYQSKYLDNLDHWEKRRKYFADTGKEHVTLKDTDNTPEVESVKISWQEPQFDKGVEGNPDEFFNTNKCDRCSGPLDQRIMSWFNNDTICMECSETEDKIKRSLPNRGADHEGIGYVPNIESNSNLKLSWQGTELDLEANSKFEKFKKALSEKTGVSYEEIADNDTLWDIHALFNEISIDDIREVASKFIEVDDIDFNDAVVDYEDEDIDEEEVQEGYYLDTIDRRLHDFDVTSNLKLSWQELTEGGEVSVDEIMKAVNTHSEAMPGNIIRPHPTEFYRLISKIPYKQLVPGTKYADSYNRFNDGMEIMVFNGFSSEGKLYSSMGEIFAKYGVRSLRALEDMKADVRMNCSDGKHTGNWFYIFEGRWSRGSGAEALTFWSIEEVVVPHDDLSEHIIGEQKRAIRRILGDAAYTMHSNGHFSWETSAIVGWSRETPPEVEAEIDDIVTRVVTWVNEQPDPYRVNGADIPVEYKDELFDILKEYDRNSMNNTDEATASLKLSWKDTEEMYIGKDDMSDIYDTIYDIYNVVGGEYSREIIQGIYGELNPEQLNKADMYYKELTTEFDEEDYEDDVTASLKLEAAVDKDAIHAMDLIEGTFLEEYDTIIFDLDGTVWDVLSDKGEGMGAYETSGPYKLQSRDVVTDIEDNVIQLHKGISEMLDILDLAGKNLGIMSRGEAVDLPFEAQPSTQLLKKFEIYGYFNYEVIYKAFGDKSAYVRPRGKTLFIDDDKKNIDSVNERGDVDVLHRKAFNNWLDLLSIKENINE